MSWGVPTKKAVPHRTECHDRRNGPVFKVFRRSCAATDSFPNEFARQPSGATKLNDKDTLYGAKSLSGELQHQVRVGQGIGKDAEGDGGKPE